MFKKAAQQGRSERKAEAYSLRYVEALSDARTKLEAFFNILLIMGLPLPSQLLRLIDFFGGHSCSQRISVGQRLPIALRAGQV